MSNSRPDYRGNPLDFIGILADVAGGLGDWIANGTPDAGSIPAEIQQRYRDHCDAWSNGPTWVQQFDPGARLFLSNACAPWLSSQGSGDPVNDVPFTGGQCDCARYQVSVDYRTGGSNPQDRTTQQARVRGPITAITTLGGRVRITCKGFSTNLSGSNYPACGSLSTFNLTSSPVGAQEILGLNIIEAPDGDDCGDPPGEIGPNPNPRPDPGLDPEDQPFNDPTGRPVLPMPEIPDPFGDPVQLPNFPLPNIEGPSLFPKDEPGRNPEDDPGEPGTPVDIPAGDEAEETAPEGEELVGVKVEFTTVPGQPRQPSNVIGPQFYIGGAYVFMGVDGQGLELQGEGTLIESGQFFFAARPSDKWRVVAALGYAVRVTPYYREVST